MSPRVPRRLRLLALFASVGALAVGTGAYLGSRPTAASTATLMGLSRVPRRPAPNFTLTDQHGRVRSLASFRGKPVAIYFMDPKCTDVCPIVAQEFVDADRALGKTARRVALIGVDVNPGATAVHWLRTFDAEHSLDALSNWYYFTGPLAKLESVWEHYTIRVQLTKSGSVVHTTLIDFVDSRGIERALAVPQAEIRPDGTGYLPAGAIAQFGEGIATELRKLLRENPSVP